MNSIKLLNLISTAFVFRAAFALLFITSFTVNAGYSGPIIDAHSQVDHHVNLEEIVPMMDRAHIEKVILSARGRIKPEQIASLARKYPQRVVASVRTKGNPWSKNSDKFYKKLKKQLKMAEFRAMAELILWHAAKGNKAPEWVIQTDSPQAQAAMNAAFKRSWPVVLHYEFRAAGQYRKTLFKELNNVLHAHPKHPFLLIHMAQLNADEAEKLLKTHSNLHFLTSHSNPVVTSKSKQPWTRLFDGRHLKQAWKKLMETYPDRFILGFDNVWADHWSNLYADQAEIWRDALGELPGDVARAIAYKNALRLWNLAELDK